MIFLHGGAIVLLCARAACVGRVVGGPVASFRNNEVRVRAHVIDQHITDKDNVDSSPIPTTSEQSVQVHMPTA
jgi:hypothetical protein